MLDLPDDERAVDALVVSYTSPNEVSISDMPDDDDPYIIHRIRLYDAAVCLCGLYVFGTA
jgi:hypothetical protein